MVCSRAWVSDRCVVGDSGAISTAPGSSSGGRRLHLSRYGRHKLGVSKGRPRMVHGCKNTTRCSGSLVHAAMIRAVADPVPTSPAAPFVHSNLQEESCYGRRRTPHERPTSCCWGAALWWQQDLPLDAAVEPHAVKANQAYSCPASNGNVQTQKEGRRHRQPAATQLLRRPSSMDWV